MHRLLVHFGEFVNPPPCCVDDDIGYDAVFRCRHEIIDQLRNDTTLGPLFGSPPLHSQKTTLADYGLAHHRQYLDAVAGLARGEVTYENKGIAHDAAAMAMLLPHYLEFLGVLHATVEAFRFDLADRAFCFGLGGHHAGTNFGHGYCLLNPLAAAVRHAQTIGFKRVLIADWDIHHGDGTQDIFAFDPSIYHISIHSMVDPYMAKASQLEWATEPYARKLNHCNIPLLASMFDAQFLEEEKLSGPYWRSGDGVTQFLRALAEMPWQPDLIAVFAGTDSHRDDCGAGVTDWTEQDFVRLLEGVLGVAEANRCPILLVSGGNYRADSAVATYKALIQRLTTT